MSCLLVERVILVGKVCLEKMMNKDREDKIRTILNYLKNKMNVMNDPETKKVRNILQNDDITLQEVVEWYIEYVWRSA